MRKARLKEIRLPEFGVPVEMPELDADIYRNRLDRLRRRISDAGLGSLVIYADREHCANMAWLTGFDPRFEEALLVLPAAGEPVIFAGLENHGVAAASPLKPQTVLYPPMGLMGQDRSKTPVLEEALRDAGLKTGHTIGVAGWKYFGPLEMPDGQNWLEIPAYIADTIRAIAGGKGRVVNAGALFMHPETGLRAKLELEELARFEFAACHTSEAVKRVLRGTRPGMREFEAASLMQTNGLPLSCHVMFSSGERAWFGLPSPTSKLVERGEAVTTAYGVQGALNCRNGWLAESADDLPENIRDYVEKLAAPYFEAVSAWLELLAIGVRGGDLYDAVMSRIGDPFFGVTLNPGHLIHLDEWMHSPVSRKSEARLATNMALQVDVIPATGSPWFTANMEDGFAMLDDAGRDEFAERWPHAWERIQARRNFMQEKLGISLHEEVMPFSNLASHLAPFWLSPNMAFTIG
ncbi:MAG: aminopeptidase P family N-terminal domain-containing protein [Nitratireductor sp.]